MANSKYVKLVERRWSDILTDGLNRYEYVRQFERDEILLPNTWIVVRIDGRGFHRYFSSHGLSGCLSVVSG